MLNRVDTGLIVLIRSCLLGLAASVFLVAAAQAQSKHWRGWSDFFPNLSKQDYALAEKQAREGLTGKPVGTVLAWNNPKSGNSGTARLKSPFQWKGHSCRMVVHEFSVKQRNKQRWEVSLCQIDGQWKWSVPPRKL